MLAVEDQSSLRQERQQYGPNLQAIYARHKDRHTAVYLYREGYLQSLAGTVSC